MVKFNGKLIKMSYEIPKFFTELNPRLIHYIQDYLHWTSFNKIQEEAIPVINKGEDTLLIAPTASGKTEAVMIPVFNDILNNHLEPMSVLYISPLKALINDMNSRIEKWSEYFSLTTTRWHGDVNSSQKAKFIKNPTDFLSITPESLEVILMNKSQDEKIKIFKNLKYVIIDEIHYFIETDRGTQLNSLLNRIGEYCDNDFIKLGLSATVGNPEEVAKWLNYKKPAHIVKINQDPNFFYDVNYGDELNICKRLERYKNTKKVLIFAQSRSDVEKYNRLLKRELNMRNILVHHSSIDKVEREENEIKFKNWDNGFMISTTTLELGIDIGNIFTVAQINPPNTVSSFMQKLGRSGRAQKASSKTIMFYENEPQVFMVLAEILLAKKNMVENIKIIKKPYDIYFHQILSTVHNKGKILKKDLYFYLHDCYSFQSISSNEFRRLIDYMVEEDFLEENYNFLSTGYTFEKKFGKINYRDFYAVFCPNNEFNVKHGIKTVGTIDPTYALMLKVGDSFVLGGKHWEITQKDIVKYNIQVVPDNFKSGEVPGWNGDGPLLSYMLSRKIFSLLLNDFNHDIFNKNKSKFDDISVRMVNKQIENARFNGFNKDVIPVEIDSETGKIYIYTFAGDKANQLLSLIFKLYYDTYKVNNCPFYTSFKIKDNYSFEDLENIILNVKKILSDNSNKIKISNLLGTYYKNKFINFIPPEYNAQLKFDLLFDEENLIKLCEQKQPVPCGKSLIKEWGEN